MQNNHATTYMWLTNMFRLSLDVACISASTICIYHTHAIRINASSCGLRVPLPTSSVIAEDFPFNNAEIQCIQSSIGKNTADSTSARLQRIIIMRNPQRRGGGGWVQYLQPGIGRRHPDLMKLSRRYSSSGRKSRGCPGT